MDHQYLTRLAQHASFQVLNYHLLWADSSRGLSALDKESELKISEKIKMFLPLAHRSPNKQEAFVEVICDAALVVAEKYNLNKRAFYAAVQNLATVTLLPSIFENAGDPVPLSAHHLRLYEDSDAEEGEKEDHEKEDHEKEDHEKEGVKPHTTATKSGALRNSWVHWTKAEIRKVIDLRFAGQPYPAIAAQLGRTVPAVQGKWSLAGKPDSGWKDYIEKKKNEIWTKQSDEELQPPVPAADTVDATNTPAALDPARDWTGADTQILIDYKIDGLSNRDISERMRRPPQSIHCQWMNMASSTKGVWFDYIRDQIREKIRREEQAKASQDDTGDDADVTGQPKWTQVLTKRKRAPSSVAQEATDADDAEAYNTAATKATKFSGEDNSA
ncbi:hypothetical protein LA080_005466 [Diaporthe eres]|uniref:Myb-like domain-containing protein n=1 Tax=Diaporthe vaccinii TaxID=105482 RepID=A0ABR4DWG9_9PEZI|nr:hypothetical protein LA080_005466 [Diaporthe eres]